MGDIHKLGPKGEAFALELLKKRGHRPLECNFSCPQGEIDLITWHNKTLVFVEVRARAEGGMQSGVESITPAKQRRVIRAAHWYLLKKFGGGKQPDCRFDVISLTARGAEVVAGEVFEGAFTS